MIDNKVPGVYMQFHSFKFSVRISVKGKRIHLGCFFKKIDAVKMRFEAEKIFGRFENGKSFRDSKAFKYIKSIEPDFLGHEGDLATI